MRKTLATLLTAALVAVAALLLWGGPASGQDDTPTVEERLSAIEARLDDLETSGTVSMGPLKITERNTVYARYAVTVSDISGATWCRVDYVDTSGTAYEDDFVTVKPHWGSFHSDVLAEPDAPIVAATATCEFTEFRPAESLLTD